MSSLYHNSAKIHHGYKNDTVIDVGGWAYNQVFLLGSLFRNYSILFKYINNNEEVEGFPFKLSK